MKLFFTSAAISVFTAFCLTIAGETRASDFADYQQLIQKEPKVETPAPPTNEWKSLNRLLACNSLDYIKSILTSRGYEIWAGGGKNPDYQPNDPFNNLIIVRNPVTKEFIILLIKPEINLACIIAGGQSIETIENMDLDIEL